MQSYTANHNLLRTGWAYLRSSDVNESRSRIVTQATGRSGLSGCESASCQSLDAMARRENRFDV
jgi:hypothetical protein